MGIQNSALLSAIYEFDKLRIPVVERGGVEPQEANVTMLAADRPHSPPSTKIKYSRVLLIFFKILH